MTEVSFTGLIVLSVLPLIIAAVELIVIKYFFKKWDKHKLGVDKK